VHGDLRDRGVTFTLRAHQAVATDGLPAAATRMGYPHASILPK